MGERKGQNFYYPPDFDPVKHGNLNRYHGVHALRERAAKIKEGILVIRFEMPFNIWCEGCCRHVAMGVRYNAEKKKVGNYYSTPIYEFRMRCHLCENYFVIRTDPAAFDYELVEGCKRQEKRWQPGDYDGVEHTGRETSQRLASDPMFKLEHGEKGKAAAAEDVPRMEALEALQDRRRDDFLANSVLRSDFRSRKKELAAQGDVDAELLARSSLGGLPLLSERDEDRHTAALLARAPPEPLSHDQAQSQARQRIAQRPLFSSAADTPSTSASSSPASALAVPGEGLAKTAKRVSIKNKQQADAFRQSLRRSSALGKSSKSSSSLADLGGLVRKRPADSNPSSPPSDAKVPCLATPSSSSALSALSGYSDSDHSSPSNSPSHSSKA